jgi:hypothetical protein
MDPEDSVRRMSSQQIDTAIDRINRELRQLNTEKRFVGSGTRAAHERDAAEAS